MRRIHAAGRSRAAALAILLVAGCSRATAPAIAPATTASPATAIPSDTTVIHSPTVAAMIGSVTRAELKPAVDDLSGEAPTVIGHSRYTFATRNSQSGKGIDMAERYVYETLQSYGLDSVTYDPYPGVKTPNWVVYPGRNVIGQITGTTKPDEIVVIGAHMDDVPWSGPAPGADDDASGVSAVLYLAREFAGKSFDRTIRFAFFNSEENGPWNKKYGMNYGSGYYAAQAKAAGENIVAMISADALAYNEGQVAEMHTRRPARATSVGDAAIFTAWRDAITTYGITGLTPIKHPNNLNWSDNGSFWNNGYPAVLFIEDDSAGRYNHNWHTTGDTVSTFNWPFYLAMTKSLVGVASHEAGIIS